MPSYDKVRLKMKPGDVLLFEGRGFWPWLIRWRTASRITHTGFVFEVHGRLACLEAAEGVGVRVFPLREYLRAGHKIYWCRLLDIDYGISRDGVMEYALAQWGKRYASPSQFVRSFGLLGRCIAKWLGLPLDTNKERFFCSELVVAALLYGGWEPERKRDPATVSPGDLQFETCLKMEGELAI